MLAGSDRPSVATVAARPHLLSLSGTPRYSAALHDPVLHMPAKNPRLSVVLSPSLAATLAALSHATGESASSLVRSLLEQTEPALRRMLQLVLAASQAKEQIGQGVTSSLHQVVDDIEEVLSEAQHRLDLERADLVGSVEAVKGRRRPRVSPNPRPVIRGSGSPAKSRKGGQRG